MSGNNDSLRRLLVVQRRRLVATVLSHAEREIYPDLTAEQRDAFRTKFLSAIDSYHDLMLDILGSSHDDREIINVEAMELLRDIRAQVAKEA